jgi:shikimate dehydrogenase
MLASYSYELKELMATEVEKFLSDKNFKGVNVTIPYKETVIPFLDEVDEVARMIGAVNTIVNRSGRLIGYNTDFYGLTALFSHAGMSPEGKKVAILGTGGTSKTACAVVRALHAREILVVSRTPSGEQIGYEELKGKHRDIEILINTTPCGMYPMCEDTPLSLDGFDALSGVIDAIYNPLTTALVRGARARGIEAHGGLYMLVAQAVRASELFLSRPYPEGTTDRIFSLISKAKNNIVLIGMPSSGKSTVGREVAEALGREFLDTDVLISERAGMEISEIFERHGEEYFRNLEAKIIKEV